MKVSICIGTYEMKGAGVAMLTQALVSINSQSYPDIEIVISDHSQDAAIEDFLKSIHPKYPIRYVRNEHKRGSSSANFNNAIRHASGDIIKILCQDDFLLDDESIACTVDAFRDPKIQWAVTSYYHTKDGVQLFRLHVPIFNEELWRKNTIGSHSCLAFRKSAALDLFDENLIWLMDCEYYYRLARAHGKPILLARPTVVNTMWVGQVTYTLADDGRREEEVEYVKKKHASSHDAAQSEKAITAAKPINNLDKPMDAKQQQAVQLITKHYEARCAFPTDINEHLPTLKKLAQECQVIVEMGVRSIVSSWAFLAGRPSQLISVDYIYPKRYRNHDPNGCDLDLVFELSELAGIEFAFHRGDSRKFQCPRCDLLFLDTLHDYEQLKAELELHAAAAQKYIVLHDTESYWFKGESAPEGIGRAVQEFIIANDSWKIIERFTNNNGLMILQRVF